MASSSPSTLLEFSQSQTHDQTKMQWQVQIVGFAGSFAVIERLQEIGLHQGTSISYVGRAPFHGPLLFRIGATVLALREEEAQCLLIQPQ